MSARLNGPGRGLVGGGTLRGAGKLTSSPLRRILVPLLCGMLLLMGWPLLQRLGEPASLDEAVLVGELPDAPVRLAIVMDVSGSMSSYWSARQEALQDLVDWSSEKLRPTDSVSVFVFADEAQVLLPETTIGQLARDAVQLVPIRNVGGGTDLSAALHVMKSELGPEPHIVAWITDTHITRVRRAEVSATTSALGVISSTTVIPKSGRISPIWQQALPGTHYRKVDPDSADQLGVALAYVIANGTGQDVRVR